MMQHRHPPSETLAAEALYTEYLPSLVDEILERLTPDSAIVTVAIRGDVTADGPLRGEGVGDRDADQPTSGVGTGASVREPSSGTGVLLLRPGGKKPQRVGGCLCKPGEPRAADCAIDDHRAAAAAAARNRPADSRAGAPLPAEQVYDETEPWFGVQYRREQVSSERLNAWQRAFERGCARAASGGASSDASSDARSDADVSSELHLPEPNEFIPSDFALRPVSTASAAAASDSTTPADPLPSSSTPRASSPVPSAPREPPKLLVNEAMGCAFYARAPRFLTPKAAVWLSITCQGRTIAYSVRDALLAALAVEVTTETLAEATYAATVAGVGYTLGVSLHGYTISSGGFSHKTPALALRVCEALAAVAFKPINPALFERAVHKMRLSLQNYGHNAADRARDARLEMVEAPHFTAAEQLAALPALTVTDLAAFLSREFFGVKSVRGESGEGGRGRKHPTPLHLTLFAHGNMTSEETIDLYRSALRALRIEADVPASRAGAEAETRNPITAAPTIASETGFDAVAEACEPCEDSPERATAAKGEGGEEHVTAPRIPSLFPQACVLLPASPARHCYQVASTNAAENNRAVEMYWQLGAESHALAAKVDLLVHLMYEPLFNRLRTKEQLGYSVSCSTRCTYGVMGFVIAVTSATHTPRHIEARVEAFLARRFLPFLSRMSKQTFLTNVEACAANKLREDHNLAEEMQRSLAEIESRQYCWDRAEREAAALRAVTQAELCSWAKHSLLGEGRRALSIYSHEGSVGNPGEQPMAAGATAVGAGFKAKLQLYRRPDQPLPPVEAA